MLANDLNIVLFSRYRTMLMGIGILGVLIGHFFSWSRAIPSNIVTLLISKVYILVFTQGFLFLSGFGLYFSYEKNPDTIDFYIRRFLRVFVPYVILTTPYFIFQDFFVNQPDLLKFLGHISTLGYWKIDREFHGLWYISISIILYVVYPFVHKTVFAKKSNFLCVTLSWGVLMSIVSAVNIFVMKIYPEFWSVYNLAMSQYSIFFVGMYTGYILQRKKLLYQLVLPIFLCFSFVLQRVVPELNFLYDPMKKICIYMPMICIFFYLLDGRIKVIHWLKRVLEWGGYFSLELYILHFIMYVFLMQLNNIGNIDSTVRASMAIISSLIFCQPIHLLIEKVKGGLNLRNIRGSI